MPHRFVDHFAGRPRSQEQYAATHRRGDHPDMTDAVKGPASYFPSIEKKYGRPITEWKELIRSSPFVKHGELVAWLKTEHGLGHGHANALVAHTLAEDKAE
ncbi:protein of unknown function [Streptomyces prasinopilosus]|uniref:DUF4287 domain-containing protein n=2 Tax=Streptomyces prasinopilosus TaxID=67344 RepID=A0A1G6NJ59_9ACTN|nr:protein of unknown function [Streptomyces prasinopilosus]